MGPVYPVPAAPARPRCRSGTTCRGSFCRGITTAKGAIVGEPVIDLLDTVWSSTADLLDDLTDAQWDTPTDLPGWSVRDAVAHMIGTERMLAGDPTPQAPGLFGSTFATASASSTRRGWQHDGRRHRPT
jgi:hypothetical protein